MRWSAERLVGILLAGIAAAALFGAGGGGRPGAELQEKPSVPTKPLEIPLPEGEGPLLVLVGNEYGFIRPCGCSKPALGGIHRRATVITALREREPGSILLSGGRVVFGETRQQQIKFEHFLLANEAVGMRALAIGREELELGAEFLGQAAALTSLPLIASNVRAPGGEVRFVPTLKLEEGFLVGGLVEPGRKIPGFEVLPWEEALEEVLAQRVGDDRLVLFANGKVPWAEKVRGALPEAVRERALVVSLGDDPLFDEGTGKAAHLQLGSKGRHLHFVRLGSAAPYREMVLKESLPGDELAEALLAGYRQAVRDEKLFTRVPRRPQPLAYQGDAACTDCHAATCVKLDATRHERAFATLLRTQDEQDPECVACHVTGWRFESDKMSAWADSTGYRSAAETPALINVTCESCHGPGQAHVEEGAAMPRSKPSPTFCVHCHDANNSPKFSFERYWPKMAHPVKEE